MESILKILEWLSKYGMIDIIFGVGIFTFIANAFKSKTTSEIDSVDLLRYIDKNNNLFRLTIKNQTSEPLYLYKAYITPGYPSDIIDTSSLKNRIKTWLLIHWKTDKFPKVINQPKTLKGEYILQIENPNNNQSPTIFIERFGYGSYILHLDPESLSNIENPNEIFEKNQFALLRLSFVNGNKAGVLEVQL